MPRWPKTNKQRFYSNVDTTGYCWVWTGGRTPEGYGVIYCDGKQQLSHRVSYKWLHGDIPKGLTVDHICNNEPCVRPAHLRLATNKQQQENSKGAYRNSKSGVRGVSQRPNGTWRVRLRHNGRELHLSPFRTMEEAEVVAIAKRNELFTHNERDRAA